MNHDQKLKAQERISYWGEAYLSSTRQSHRLAKQFFHGPDHDSFTAYLYLFVAFNNLYCLLGQFDGDERSKIRIALGRIPADSIEPLYTQSYLAMINTLNGWPTEQFTEGPDEGAPVRGVVNMRDYFLGKEPVACIEHVGNVASLTASAEDKLQTLQDVAEHLLYTVRNNQVHAVKGATSLADQRTLEIAYQVLLPLVDALMPIAGGILLEGQRGALR